MDRQREGETETEEHTDRQIHRQKETETKREEMTHRLIDKHTDSRQTGKHTGAEKKSKNQLHRKT